MEFLYTFLLLISNLIVVREQSFHVLNTFIFTETCFMTQHMSILLYILSLQI